jgi:hypothetical protein
LISTKTNVGILRTLFYHFPETMLVRTSNGNGKGGRLIRRQGNSRGNRNRASRICVPTHNPRPKFTHTFRYYSTTTAGVVFSQNSILISVGSVAVTSVLLKSLYASFRILAVKLWSVPATTAVTQPLTINWFGNNNGTGDNVGLHAQSDISINPSYPQFVASRPPPNSYTSFWQSASSVGDPGFMFEVATPAGCILDLTVELMAFDSAIGGATITRAEATTIGATVGQVYYCPLDNLTNDFRPSGVVNIIDQI